MSIARPRRDLLVVGHLNLDHEMGVDELPGPDRTVPVRSRRVFLGGTAGNIARWAARTGLRVELASFVGEDLPDEFRALLRREKVGISGVRVRKGELTPACWIARDRAGEQVTLIDQGAMGSTAREPLPHLDGVGWVHLTTGDPRYQLRLAREARRRHIPISFDPAQEIHYRWSPAGVREMLGHSSLLFANLHEAEAVAQAMGIRSPAELTEVVPVAVVTDGARGATAYTRRGEVHAPAVRVRRPAGVTGAGDAFRGAFYSGWLTGLTLERSLARGARAAASVVSHPRELLLPPYSP